MTPDRDAPARRRFSAAPDRSSGVRSSGVPSSEVDAACVDAAWRVPAPRPEVLARVLEGLRELPVAAGEERDGRTSDDDADDPPLPLPRRRS